MNNNFLIFALLCDMVIKEADTGKLSFIGLFDNIKDKKLPMSIHKINVVSRWSNISDGVKHTQYFKIIREEDGKEIFNSRKFEKIFQLKDENQSHTIIIGIQDTIFEKAGSYKVIFFLDEKIQPQKIYFSVNLSE